jgi:hypothetical protein
MGDGHDFHEREPIPKSGVDHSCWGNMECETWHPECGSGSFATLTPEARETQVTFNALQKVADGEGRSAEDLVLTFPARVQVNWARGQLQVSAPCSTEMIVAQVSLSASQLSALEQIAVDKPTQ